MTPVQGRALALHPDPSSVREARRYVRGELSAAGFHAAVFAAELLVSELVTNAILHARTAVRIAVEPRRDDVRIAVGDDSPLPPRRRRHSIESATGRGLLLVERVAAHWGVDADGLGKVVWFDLPRNPGELNVWGDLPEG